MPVLPHLYPRATIAADTRTLDARQLSAAAHHAMQSLTTHAKELLKRIPTLIKRQDDSACQYYIQGCYQGLNAGPSPGAVVGIVLGSIVGFLLILWLLWILSHSGGWIASSQLQEEEVTVRRRSRSPNRRRSHRSSYNAEMRHSSPRRDRVIRQERIVRDVPPPRNDASRVRETVIVDEGRPERRVENDDIVEVIEEHSSISNAPPPRRKSRRSSGYRSVDP